MRRCWLAVGLSISLYAMGCGGGGSDTEEPGGGTGASSGSGGSGAVGGSGGTPSDGGGSGGDGGDSATGGVGGDSSIGGSGGTTDGSTGGTAGTAGDSAAGGSGGDSGMQDSSTGGTAGTGGAPDAGDDGAAGSGGGWPTQCSTCHGSTANPAPPLDINGNSDTSFAGVGSHQSHIAPSDWHRQVLCNECHIVPTVPYDPAIPTHMNGEDDITWGPLAQQGIYDPTGLGCSSTYCHGATLDPDKAGTTSIRTPLWTTVDGSQKACGTSCHTLPPGGAHPAASVCEACHDQVISSFVAGNPPTVTWANANLHIDGKVDVVGLDCTSCHGNPATNDPAPPLGTNGETQTTQAAVGAHAQHLSASSWHRTGQCADCHATPGTLQHSNNVTDFSWASPSNADGATPSFVTANLTCTGSYCHGTTLAGPNAGGTVNRVPVWNVVDNSWDACGATCHTNPPGGAHPASSSCPTCHGAVLSAYNPSNPAATAWANPNLHIDGKVDVASLTCTSCHGNPVTNDPAPPLGTSGETQTTQAAVGAHAQHLSASTWHRTGQCADCHATPATLTHSNNVTDFSWASPSNADGATPSFVTANLSCTGSYCHGTTLAGANAGGSVNRVPVWNVVNNTWDACGATCHTNPPGGAHPASSSCPTCHGAVITAYSGTPPTATWTNAALHINGSVEVAGLTCTSCHGDPATSQPAPPLGTGGETATNQAAVGAHRQHLGTSTWHRDGQCADCHTVPTSTGHSTGVTDFAWGAPANADGANTTYSATTLTCNGNYCHGTTLLPAKSGGTVARTPAWTTVNGTWDGCGTTCHTNPPGGTHPAHTDCRICHTAVVATFDPATNATTWTDRAKHVNGAVESNKYHDLTSWTSPKNQTSHHGSNYFLTNQQRDEHNTACTQCHGASLDGGTVGVSCNNASCHNGDWKACTFCHGTPPSQNNPPIGVGGETATNTLAVGRHVAHLASSATHAAFTCATCHAIPPAGNVAHAAQYVPSADLTTAGHHGDIAFTLGATGMTFNVNGVAGNPVNARGTCIGACHSNGRGGNPVVTPYWAGGTWNAGSCGTCHAALPNNGEHTKHYPDEVSACTGCHPAANSSSHMNGSRDVNATISGGTGGGSVTVRLPGTGGPCGNRVGCSGNCHGKNHNAECW